MVRIVNGVVHGQLGYTVLATGSTLESYCLNRPILDYMSYGHKLIGLHYSVILIILGSTLS